MNGWFLSDLKTYTEITIEDWTDQIKQNCLLVYYEYIYPIKEDIKQYISPIKEDVVNFIRGPLNG